MSWTDERIEKLTKMWEGGATASQIAEELGGVSRNAVIGKAHRLGLKARPSPVKANEKPARAAAPKKAKTAPAEPPAAKAVEVAPAPAPAPARPAAPAPAPAPARAAGAAYRFGRPRRFSSPRSGRPAGPDPTGAAAPPRAGKAQP